MRLGLPLSTSWARSGRAERGDVFIFYLGIIVNELKV
jgi:hypothetical protein